MKSILIVDKCQETLSLLENVNHNNNDKNSPLYMGGMFTEFDIMNNNKRIYTKDNFLPVMENFKSKVTANENKGVYGEFDHPDVFDLSLQRSSHLIKDIKYNESKNNVEGKIQILTTHYGKEVRSLINDKAPIFVSSRAAGVTESNNMVRVNQLFTYDIVADPGFSNAQMGGLNESFGYSSNANFRIFEFNDTNKINNYLNMNENNEYVTTTQMKEYSKYMATELERTAKLLENKNMSSNELQKLLEFKDSMLEQNEMITKYFKEMYTQIYSLSKQNNYLKEKLSNTIKFVEHVAENTKNVTDYSEYIAENVKNVADFSEYIAENVKNVKDYSEYIAEGLNNNINFSEYIAENTDLTIKHTDYVAENVNDNIKYLNYLTEKVEGGYKYSEYLAEKITEANSLNVLNEAVVSVETPVEFLGLDKEDETQMDGTEDTFDFENKEELSTGMEDTNELENTDDLDSSFEDEDSSFEDEDSFGDDTDDYNFDDTEDSEEGSVVNIAPNTTNYKVDVSDDGGIQITNTDTTNNDINLNDDISDEVELTDEESDEALIESVKMLIEETKKQKVSKVKTTPHFFSFLTTEQVNDFKKLSKDQQNTVIVALNESKGNYTTGYEVMNLIRESLNKNKTTFIDTLISKIPYDLKETWTKQSKETKGRIIAESKLFDFDKESKFQAFWETRKFETSNLLNETNVVDFTNEDNDKINEQWMTKMLNRIESLKS